MGVHTEDGLEGDTFTGRIVEPHLAVVLVGAAVGGPREAGHEEGTAVGPPLTLEFAGAGDLVVAELPANGRGGGISVGDIPPPNRVTRAGLCGLGQIRNVRAAPVATHGLQSARDVAALGLGQSTKRTLARCEAGRRSPAQVQAVGIAGIFGQVDGAGGRIDGDRLVGVATHELQRYEALSHVRFAAGRVDFKHVAVILRVAGATDATFGFLAAQPRPPRGDPAGTVIVGSGQARVLADAIAILIDGDRRGAANGTDVVGEAIRDGNGVCFPAAVLVVRDDDRATGQSGEDPHAVGVARMGAAVIGRRHPRLRNHCVREALWQRQYAFRVRQQRAIPGGGTGSGSGAGERIQAAGTGEDEAEARCGSATEEAPAGHG